MTTEPRLNLALRADQIDALPSLSDLLKFHGLKPTKALGQNFLLDLNLTAKIARAALEANGGNTQGTTIEVGPGPGGLTRALLLQDFQHVVAIEKDARAVALLQSLVDASLDTLTVIEADALTIDPRTLGPAPHRVIANLPYNVGTALVTNWLEQIAHDPDTYDSITVLLQKEVVNRLVAEPGTKAFGRLSVLTQWLCQASSAFDIPPTAFIPPPKVMSAVAVLRPRPRDQRPFDCSLSALSKVTAALFNQRRKMIRQAIKGLGPIGLEILVASGIDPTKRAEALTLQEFGTLARLFERA